MGEQEDEKKANSMLDASAVPDSETASDEEIFTFGMKFFKGYVGKLAVEFAGMQAAIELRANLNGAEPTQVETLKLVLQMRMVKVLDRFIKLVEGSVEDGN